MASRGAKQGQCHKQSEHCPRPLRPRAVCWFNPSKIKPIKVEIFLSDCTSKLQIPILVIGTKLDLVEKLRGVSKRNSAIAEECGADEIHLVSFCECCLVSNKLHNNSIIEYVFFSGLS
jgi:hypothetical protein